MSNSVECPLCGEENDMSEGLIDLPSDNTFDHSCEHCGRDFEVFVEFNPEFSGSEIIYEVCDKCKKVTRNFKRRRQVYPFPENHKGDVFCEPCYLQEVANDMKLKFDK